jgi:diguanylate cyclase (GGDEF)-like protein/PAS domain S-box-containing protein
MLIILRTTMNFHIPKESLLRAFIADSGEAISCIELDGTVAIWNEAAEKLYGFSAEEVLGKHFILIIPLYEFPAMEALLSHPESSLNLLPESIERLHKRGNLLNVQIQRSVLRSENGVPLALLERASTSSTGFAETAAAAHLRLLKDQMPVIFWTADRRLRITSYGGAGFRRMRLFQGIAPGQTIHESLACKQNQETPVKQHLEALQGISSRFEYRNGKHIFDMNLEPMKNIHGDVIGCIGVALDITERKKTEEEIHYQATHDGLTGLFNYREFVDRLENEIIRAVRGGHRFGLLLLDLDKLKNINDSLGHLAGNRALKTLAKVMKDSSRNIDLVARYGGDEFGLLLIDADREMTAAVADRIRDGLRRETNSPALTVSIGAVVCPEDGTTALDLLEVADRRLYTNKQATKEQFRTASAK